MSEFAALNRFLTRDDRRAFQIGWYRRALGKRPQDRAMCDDALPIGDKHGKPGGKAPDQAIFRPVAAFPATQRPRLPHLVAGARRVLDARPARG
ncbi:MAG TPA: hypothetical protein PLI13_02275 [Paracoccus sp. (in: a-proteobacteria)]|nr:hypothetical protein [Paracoccus sp. (in: a-proteobacteria)]